MGNALGLGFYITICCVAFVASKVVISVLCYKRWRERQQLVYGDSLSGGKIVMFRNSAMRSLTSESFMKKTLKLSNKDIIGTGGFGTVYKLVVNESMAFAVKRLHKGTSDGDKGFERELEAMGDIKHRNIVTLHGYCTSPRYNLLIYELMTNGSKVPLLFQGVKGNVLDCTNFRCNEIGNWSPRERYKYFIPTLSFFLLITYNNVAGKSMNKKLLDWPTRCKIAVGAARGISYLHHDCIPHIIHRDIKSSNILLDQNMNARVSDFGLATMMEPDKTHVSTFVAGTFGYLAPEYFETGRATAKGDVYSFGVVLLELLTGKKPTDDAFLEEGTKLVTWVKSVVKDKREEYVLDPSLECCPIDEINHVFSIALMCLEPEPSGRPTMAEVVRMLEQKRPEKFVND